MDNQISIRFSIIVLILSMAYVYYCRTNSDIKWSPTVTTETGKIRGTVSKSRDGREFYSWLNIPYGQPPIAALRFQTPKPVTKWVGVRDGNLYGDKCPQINFLTGAIEGNEDCLYLNIHVPKLKESLKGSLATLVFFHGGSYILGSGEDIKPDYFMDQDIIFVTVNYRLGLFGFTSTGDKNIRGNMALKDQTLALQWINKNIQNFGGDSNKITLIGQSAGGASVHYLMMSKLTKGLFNKAISISGVSILPWAFRPPEFVINKTKKLAHDLNCPTESSDKMTECLRHFTMHELLEAFKQDARTLSLSNPANSGSNFPPTVELVDDDEAFLTEYPFDIIKKGLVHRVPFLSGVTNDEGLWSAFSFYREDGALEKVEKDWDASMENYLFLSTKFSAAEATFMANKLKEFYLPDEGLTRDERISKLTQLATDGQFAFGLSETAKVQKEFSPVYLYFYNKTGGAGEGGLGTVMANLKSRFHPYIELFILYVKFLWNKHIMGNPPRNYGVCHAEDLVMISPAFPFLDIGREDSNYQFSKDFVSLLVQFASGDETLLEFRGTTLEANFGRDDEPLKYLVIDDKSELISEPFKNRMEFWHSLNYNKLFSATVNNL